jgi:serine/threonine protein kinase
MDVQDLCMGCMTARQGASRCPDCGFVEGMLPQSPVHLPPRTVLRDQYLLGRVLGHGGFGIAYLGWDSHLEMKVAVKEFLPTDYATRGAQATEVTPYSGESRDYFEYGLTRFLDEGRAVARFNDHPGIVPVLNFFRDNGTGYLVMQYVPGMSFKEYLALSGGKISFDEAVSIINPVMDTLRDVHQTGMLHRDISPDNIYISTTKRVKLLDFGAARLALGDRSQSLSVILKAGYAPFEQYQSRGRQGAWTDVYALGATLYRAITGMKPPEASARVAGEPLLPPHALGIAIPPDAERVLLRAIAVEPEERYQEIAEFQQALVQHAGPRVPPIPPPPRPPPLPVTPPALAPSPLEAIVAPLAAIAKPVNGAIAQVTGLVPAPDELASARQVALVIAVVGGLIGTVVTMWFGLAWLGLLLERANAPLLVGVVRAGVVCLGAAAMTLGALAGLGRDRRGVDVVWAAGWLLVVAGLAGAGLQIVANMTQTAMGLLAFTVASELRTALQALVPAGLVLMMLWIRRSPTVRPQRRAR